MFEYIVRLLILVPTVGGLAWGSLWLWRRLQMGLPAKPAAHRSARVIDVLPIGSGTKLATVSFGDSELLIAISRSQTTLIAQQSNGDFHV
jgi:flagellar protein FliO/FliZ